MVEILLVEDNRGDVRLMQEALDSGVPCRITIVEDGAKAMVWLRAKDRPHRPDLILLDLNLPRMNGWEVLREIKSDPALRQIPVVVLTSSEADRDVHRAYDLGANSYVRKPVDLDAFLRAVRSIESFWLATVTLPPAH